ncbi:MAG TPA: NAD-dependent epimerase/dehydratase family protein [Bacteroidia bacterium]|nr:NAD-dependent epimerase/dehydratase family protein [Bacteroidia bacterium]
MKILITGTAGFIGHHLAQKLSRQQGNIIFGLDSINDYYDVNIKYNRLGEQGFKREEIAYNKLIKTDKGHYFIQLKLEDKKCLDTLFEEHKFDIVINLAAQAGVRYSLTNPQAYIDCNIQGFINILECCRYNAVKHLIYASSSSVYGLNKRNPFSVTQNVDHPISLYAASKKSNELMAHVYSHLFGLPTTGLRFFTVYGPWGRPDMALFIFTKNILEGKPIEVYNNGDMMRDFTYVNDITESVSRLVNMPPAPHPELADDDLPAHMSTAPYRIFNIGNNNPVMLMDFIHAIEEVTGKRAEIIKKPLQMGDVPKTYADVQNLFDYIDFKPGTYIKDGVKKFVDWFVNYYGYTLESSHKK